MIALEANLPQTARRDSINAIASQIGSHLKSRLPVSKARRASVLQAPQWEYGHPVGTSPSAPPPPPPPEDEVSTKASLSGIQAPRGIPAPRVHVDPRSKLRTSSMIGSIGAIAEDDLSI